MALDGKLAKTNGTVRENTSKLFNNGDKKPGKLGGMVDDASGIQKNVAGAVVGGGNIVAKVAGAFGGGAGKALASALTGSSEVKYNPYPESGATGGLKSFYRQFSKAKLDSIDRIDPFSTFECTFKFFPSVTGTMNVTKLKSTTTTTTNTYDDEWNWGGESTNRSKDEQESSDGNVAMDTTIGKLLQQVKYKNTMLEDVNVTGDKDLDSQTFSTDSKSQEFGEKTTETNVHTDYELIHTKRSVTADLFVDLGIYIQKLIVPNIRVEGGEEVTTLVGKFPIPGNLVIPDNNQLQMEIVNMEAPIAENIFYPWMRETTFPWWSYDDQPFTTASITIDFTQHSNIIYHFFGCRPTQIMLVQPDQSPNQNLTRNVQFTFDFMSVETVDTRTTKYKGAPPNKKTYDKSGGGATSLANGALFSAANTLKL